MPKEHKHTIKYYHIILLSIMLSPILIINSNYAVEKRNKEKLNKEADRKLKKILFGRHLESFEEGMEKICKKGTEELKEYYVTGALEKLDIDPTKKEEEEENPEYINALLDIVKGYVGEESENDLMENIKTYGMHVLGIGVFLAIAVLSIPGWIVCCFCCCCNCCCCCCCKKPSCKLPFFIVTTVLYVLVAVVCIYGLSKSNSIFKGVADTECSILKFSNEIIEGETKEQKPKWAGIEGLKKLIDDVKDKIKDIKDNRYNDLNTQKNSLKGIRKAFEDELDTNSKNVIANTNAVASITNFEGTQGTYHYKLDITIKKTYGEFTKGNRFDTPTPATITPSIVEPEKSFMYAWFREYSETADNSEIKINEGINNFDTILAQNGAVSKSLDSAKTTVDEIGGSIEGIKDGISNTIIEYSDYIDDYGKLGFKVYFAVLIVIDVLIAVLIFLLCFFSGKLCNKCCCCRCIFKLLIHVLWNILALLMIITFLIGFLFSFIGTIGKDMVSVLNYFISAENLGKPEPTLFGESGKQLNSCFNGDGVFLDNLDAMGSFDQLDEINNNLIAYENTFIDLSGRKLTYTEMKNSLEERTLYKNCDFQVFATVETADPISYKLSTLIEKLNSKIPSGNTDYWFCNACGTAPTGKTCKIIKDVNPAPTDYTGTDAEKIATIINTIKSLVTKAGGTASDSFLQSIENIEAKYEAFLGNPDIPYHPTTSNGILGILRTFRGTITELNSLFDEYVGENGSVLDFINCKFIGNNIQVILKNLKDCLGGDFYTVGICLLMAGCSMAISICFTILLIIIINTSVDQNKKEGGTKTIPFS